MDPNCEMEQSKRRSFAAIRRFELREASRNASRVYAVAVASIALVILIVRWLAS